MRTLPLALFCLGLATLPTATGEAQTVAASRPDLTRPLAYPPAPRGSVVDTLHGQAIADPYRWLEDLGSAATRAWVAAENALTTGYLAGLPGRAGLHSRLAALYSVDSFRLPQGRGGRYFWLQQDAGQDHPVLRFASSLSGASQALLDGNAIAASGKGVLGDFVASESGARFAYGLAVGSGDWQTWHLRDVGAEKDLPDELAYIKYYPPAFTADGRGLYYSRFPAPPAGRELVETDHDHKVYFHRLGTPSASDVVVYARPDHPSFQFEPTVTRDGRYLIITIGDGQVGDSSREQIAYLDLSKPGQAPTLLVDTFEAEFLFIGNAGPRFFFQTTLGAAKKRIVAIDIGKPLRSAWQEIVPEGRWVIDGAAMAAGQLFVTTLQHAHSVVTAYDLAGRKIREVPLPGLGSVRGFQGGPNDRETFFLFTGFTTPTSIYRHEPASGKTELWRGPKVPFAPEALETTQVFFPSRDGVQIPMFLTHKKGLPRDGVRPTLLRGYGVGGLSQTPFFDPSMIAWIERGGIYGVVNIRGGGEYGEAWRIASERTRRRTGIDDFIAAGEWLIKNGYTATAHLGAFGGSGGGMLVGSVAVLRPDLFGAIVPLVGVHDLLRFHLFGQGAGWQAGIGYVNDPADFRALLATSPLHNVRAATRYPSMLLITSDHDIRVAPLHSYKFAAALQAAQAGPAPVLLRVFADSGHFGGSSLSQRIEQRGEYLLFFANALGLPLP
ncbi:MAG TPA: prolyl oligopeptidase family serine peptidase [Pseudomonadota bacterium]|nr:prolyl oligopeptidase family serine peptidase [Pseudomonadota bacterium]